ncbi:MAG: TlpA family protein disulfide reductase [Planctomycetes bacterium]|nr:TlpA family protein disulfide reductase [Planctomycetota bacterium]
MEEMKDKPFALIGVNSDDTIERAKKAIEEHGLNWRSFQNQDAGRERAIADDWAVSGWPTCIVIDQDMVIRYRGHDGHAASKVAEELVAKFMSR